ncbi:MAG: pseudouridine synthase, partial [Desulfatirhabdiaceae bacterium]
MPITGREKQNSEVRIQKKRRVNPSECFKTVLDENLMPMRLQKFLSTAGICSRRHGETLITAGRVRINGQTVRELGISVDPDTDRVEVDGRPVEVPETRLYIALNKPAGYVTSCSQPGEKLVTDLISIPDRVYPVGRLDKESTGLLLLTSDGSIHHRLSHPSFDHEKEYEITLDAPVSDDSLGRLAAGMPILGSQTRPAEVIRISSKKFRMILKEGKNRQIRRMVGHIGHRIVKLKRIRIANIRLGRLA